MDFVSHLTPTNGRGKKAKTKATKRLLGGDEPRNKRHPKEPQHRPSRPRPDARASIRWNMPDGTIRSAPYLNTAIPMDHATGRPIESLEKAVCREEKRCGHAYST